MCTVCGCEAAMSTTRPFVCDDLFKFNRVNLDPLTETVSCCTHVTGQLNSICHQPTCHHHTLHFTLVGLTHCKTHTTSQLVFPMIECALLFRLVISTCQRTMLVCITTHAVSVEVLGVSHSPQVNVQCPVSTLNHPLITRPPQLAVHTPSSATSRS